MKQDNPAGRNHKGKRKSLSEEQFAQASLTMIQRWRQAFADGASGVPASSSELCAVMAPRWSETHATMPPRRSL